MWVLIQIRPVSGDHHSLQFCKVICPSVMCNHYNFYFTVILFFKSSEHFFHWRRSFCFWNRTGRNRHFQYLLFWCILTLHFWNFFIRHIFRWFFPCATAHYLTCKYCCQTCCRQFFYYLYFLSHFLPPAFYFLFWMHNCLQLLTPDIIFPCIKYFCPNI